MATKGGKKIPVLVVGLFNISVVLVGVAALILAAVYYSSMRFNGVTFEVQPILFMVVIGMLVLVIGFYGCIGAWRGRPWMLMLYFLLLVLSVLAFTAYTIFALARRNSNDMADDIISDWQLSDNSTQQSIQSSFDCPSPAICVSDLISSAANCYLVTGVVSCVFAGYLVLGSAFAYHLYSLCKAVMLQVEQNHLSKEQAFVAEHEEQEDNLPPPLYGDDE